MVESPFPVGDPYRVGEFEIRPGGILSLARWQGVAAVAAIVGTMLLATLLGRPVWAGILVGVGLLLFGVGVLCKIHAFRYCAERVEVSVERRWLIQYREDGLPSFSVCVAGTVAGVFCAEIPVFPFSVIAVLHDGLMQAISFSALPAYGKAYLTRHFGLALLPHISPSQ